MVCLLDPFVLELHTERGTWPSADNDGLSNKEGTRRHPTHLEAFHSARVTLVQARYVHGNGQKETEMWQTTETKTQQSDKAILIMAHLGIWLQSRHWNGGHPALLCTFSEHKEEKTARRAVIQQV